jgi:hypothetical protein
MFLYARSLDEGIGIVDWEAKEAKENQLVRRALELRAYIPGQERNLNHANENGFVHKQDVLLDLELLSYPPMHSIFSAARTTQDDLVRAFQYRYGEHPDNFGGGQKFPDAIAQIANLKAGLLHDEDWKLDDIDDNRQEYVMRREGLKEQCTMAIRRWFHQKPPFSREETEATLADISGKHGYDMNLIRVARAAKGPWVWLYHAPEEFQKRGS